MDDPFKQENVFVSLGDWQGPKDLYPPPAAGVKMTFERFALSHVDGQTSHYYKATITEDPGSTASKDIIEKSVYFPHGPDCLVAANVEVEPGLLVTETIVVSRNGSGQVDGLRHHFVFSTGQAASWGCGKQP